MSDPSPNPLADPDPPAASPPLGAPEAGDHQPADPDPTDRDANTQEPTDHEPNRPAPTDPGPVPDDLAAPIGAERLELVLIPADVLAAVDDEGATDWPGVGPVATELAETLPASLRRRQIEADPSVAPWLARGIVVPDPSSPTGARLVGHLGGHDRPDGSGMVEAGYTVAAAERGRGLATEAARAWFAWAHAHGARRARLSTTADNVASLALIARLGLTEIDPIWDEDDQVWEVVFEAPLPLAPPTRAA